MEAGGRIGNAVGCSFHLRRGEGCCTLSARPRRVYVGGGGEGFADNGHLRYYTPRVRCGAKTVDEKRRKIMKKLSRELTALICLEKDKEKEERLQVVDGEIGNKEKADALLAQLEELRAQETMIGEEEKGMKNKKKEEKAMKKIMKKREKEKKAMTKIQEDRKDEDMSSSSSSESSESSDSECDEVVDLRVNKLMGGTQSMPCNSVIPASISENDSTKKIMEQKSNVTVLLNHLSECRETSHTSVFNITRPEGDLVVTIPETATAMPMNRIEVCMGGKCKRSGALQLKEEFERVVGIEGAVVGCKCMGKCKEGPNVRVVNPCKEVETSMSLPRNPLCIGVGLEDVGKIMASYFGKNEMGLVST